MKEVKKIYKSKITRDPTKLWESTRGQNHIQPIKIAVFRMVEDQAKSSTRRLVKSNQEHEILEQLLEENKPSLTEDLQELHYLLLTPFRYPPLSHGSRFSKHTEPSIFYASLDLETAMAEKAYYRMAFIRASHAKLGEKTINMTSFQVQIETQQGIDLSKPPFVEYQSELTSPLSYQITQILGSKMRAASIQAFIYFSARRAQHKNMGVISPQAFVRKQTIEKSFKFWSCFPSKDNVEFTRKLSNQPTLIFRASDFYYQGIFPDLPG